MSFLKEIVAERDSATGLVTLTRAVTGQVRFITLNAELSAHLTAAHDLGVVWGCAELAPAITVRRGLAGEAMH